MNNQVLHIVLETLELIDVCHKNNVRRSPDDEISKLVEDSILALRRELLKPELTPAFYIHPMDIGRFESMSIDRLSDEQIGLYLEPPKIAEFHGLTYDELVEVVADIPDLDPSPIMIAESVSSFIKRKLKRFDN
jgi:hypothetical protein